MNGEINTTFWLRFFFCYYVAVVSFDLAWWFFLSFLRSLKSFLKVLLWKWVTLKTACWWMWLYHWGGKGLPWPGANRTQRPSLLIRMNIYVTRGRRCDGLETEICSAPALEIAYERGCSMLQTLVLTLLSDSGNSFTPQLERKAVVTPLQKQNIRASLSVLRPIKCCCCRAPDISDPHHTPSPVNALVTSQFSQHAVPDHPRPVHAHSAHDCVYRYNKGMSHHANKQSHKQIRLTLISEPRRGTETGPSAYPLGQNWLINIWSDADSKEPRYLGYT